MSIKSKVTLGITALFTLLLAISIVALIYINLLSARIENLLSANYKSIQYCNEMMHIMDELNNNGSLNKFETALIGQEHNITEKGEDKETSALRSNFNQLKNGDSSMATKNAINFHLYQISVLNQNVLDQKNVLALQTGAIAKITIASLSALVLLIGFTLTVNFPGYIANPIKLLTVAFDDISQKNYHKRIHLNSNDEFGQMANAFNSMANKLAQFESSNMARVMFEKKRIETIINQMENAVFGLDASGKILFINSAAEALFGLKSDDIVGRLSNDIAKSNDLLKTILKKESKTPLKIVSENKERFYSLDARFVSKDGESLGEVFTLSDITIFKEHDISKTNLLATISHELKTPISSIKMSAKLLNDLRVGSLNAEQQELTQSINGDTERLLRLTSELLNMTQIESGNIQLKITKADPCQIALNALSAVQMQLHERQIVLKTDYSENLPDVMADQEKTEWVLINLLTNAIKYSGEKSVLELSITEDFSKIKFAVTDNGPGISAAELTRIFDRYFKAESSTLGTGLGLSIAKEFIEAQNGKINAESVVGSGSTFSFDLPISKS